MEIGKCFLGGGGDFLKRLETFGDLGEKML